MKKTIICIFLLSLTLSAFSTNLSKNVLYWIERNGHTLLCSDSWGTIALAKDDNEKLFIYANTAMYMFKDDSSPDWTIYKQDEILYKTQIEKTIKKSKSGELRQEIDLEGYEVYFRDEYEPKNSEWIHKYYVKTPEGRWYSVSEEIR